MEEILLKLATITPVVGVLIWVVLYFKAEIKTKNDEIKELNKLLREQQKETVLAIEKMVQVVDSLKELIKEKLN